MIKKYRWLILGLALSGLFYHVGVVSAQPQRDPRLSYEESPVCDPKVTLNRQTGKMCMRGCFKKRRFCARETRRGVFSLPLPQGNGYISYKFDYRTGQFRNITSRSAEGEIYFTAECYYMKKVDGYGCYQRGSVEEHQFFHRDPNTRLYTTMLSHPAVPPVIPTFPVEQTNWGNDEVHYVSSSLGTGGAILPIAGTTEPEDRRQTVGRVRLAVIPFNWRNFPQYVSRPEMRYFIQEVFIPRMERMSCGNLDIEFYPETDLANWVFLDRPASMDGFFIEDAVFEKADRMLDFSANRYNYIIVFKPPLMDQQGNLFSGEDDHPSWGGEVTMALDGVYAEYGQAWVDIGDYRIRIGTLVHEFGHALRLGHAHSRVCRDWIGNPLTDVFDLESENCFSQEYGDYYDIMGNALETEYSFNSFKKYLLGWTSSLRPVTEVPAVYHLNSLESCSAEGGLLLNLDTERDYFVDFNEAATYFHEYYVGPQIPLRRFAGRASYQLDADVVSNEGFLDAISPGTIFHDPYYADLNIGLLRDSGDLVDLYIGPRETNPPSVFLLGGLLFGSPPVEGVFIIPAVREDRVSAVSPLYIHAETSDAETGVVRVELYPSFPLPCDAFFCPTDPIVSTEAILVDEQWPFGFWFSLFDLGIGTHQFEASASDLFGNTARSNVYRFEIRLAKNYAPPSVALTLSSDAGPIANGDTYIAGSNIDPLHNTEYLYLTASAVDNRYLSRVEFKEWQVNDDQVGSCDLFALEFCDESQYHEWAYSLSAYEPTREDRSSPVVLRTTVGALGISTDRHAFQAIATDIAGNQILSNFFYVTIDREL